MRIINFMEEIHSTLLRFLQAFSTLQLDGMMSFFSDDATAFFPAEHHLPRLVGKEAIREAFSHVLEKIKASGVTQMSLDAEDVSIQAFEDVSIVTFHIRGVNLSRRTFVLQRVKGAWRIVHMHASNAPVAAKPQEVMS